MVKRLKKRFPNALKIVCAVFCLILVISMLVLPSFAGEGDSRSVSTIDTNKYYVYYGTIDMQNNLYFVDFAPSFLRLHLFNYNDNTVEIVPDYVSRIGFSVNAVKVVLYNGIIFDINVNDCAIRFIFEGTFPLTTSGIAVTYFYDSLNDFVFYNQMQYDSFADESYLLGLSEGYGDGYDVGYNQGLQDADGSNWTSIGDFLITTIGAFTSAELFYGFTIGGLLSLLVGAMLFYWFIKLLR